MRLLTRLFAGEIDWLVVSPDGGMSTGETLAGIAVLPGSFNPLHDGHRQLAAVAGEVLQRPVYFELAVINADKAPLDPETTQARLPQFSHVAPLLLTRLPLFQQKSQVFRDSVFVVGADTAARIVQPRFYQNNPTRMQAALDEIATHGCRFLVAGRKVGDTFTTLESIDIPPMYQHLFEAIPVDRFRMDISSTQLRRA